MSKPQKPKEAKSDWKKVGPCLYRFRQGTYYALLKRKGKQIRQSLKTTDLELARRELRKFVEKNETLDRAGGRQSIDEFAKRYLETLRGAEATVSKRQLHIRIMLETWPAEAPRQLDEINTQHCKTWAAGGASTYYKNSKPIPGRKLSDTALRDRLATAHSFFQLAVEGKAIAENPMGTVTRPKRGKVIRLTPTEEEFRAIVADIRSQKSNGHGADDSADFVELAGTLGLGQAELSSIQRQHIDLKAGVIHVRRKKSKETFEVPIFHDARAIIERRLGELPDGPEVRLLPQDNCKKALAGACRRLNLPHFEPRALRRYHITRAIHSGVDIPTIANWQGHQDRGELIVKVYAAEVNRIHSLQQASKLAPKPDNVVEMPTQQAAG
jgi:integrase